MAEMVQIPIGKIKAGDHTLRAGGEDETLDDLAASIGRVGVIVPLVVVRGDDGYTVVAGHRRLAACKRVGLQTIPCLVSEGNQFRLKETAFAENLFRQDLTPIEIACGLKDVIDRGIMEFDELARVMHRSEHWVSRQIAILSWPADVLEVIQNGKLSVAAASNLALIEEPNYRNFLLRTATEQGATARTTAAWLQAYRVSKPPVEAITAEPVPAGSPSTPAVPQAPCLVCGDVFRTDELSHVPICTACIKVIRNAR